MSIYIIIVAAGSGNRFGAPLPKQFCKIDGREVLMHTIANLRTACPDAQMLLVLGADMLCPWAEMCKIARFTSPTTVVGGATRFESVRNALDALADRVCDNDIIMVHDGARPVVHREMIDCLTHALAADDTADGAIPAVPVTDSLRHGSANLSDLPAKAGAGIDRAGIYAVQTPQAFRASKIIEAYRHPYSASMTDDASVLENKGMTNLLLSHGSHDNIKITYPGDLEIAAMYLHHLQNEE